MLTTRKMRNNDNGLAKASIKWGFIGGIALLLVYFLILSIANSFEHAIEQFGVMWYWVLLLAAGFGVQVGLYSFIRLSLKARAAAATAEVATAGGISTGAMVACCAHHLTDVLPIIGLSAAALFLNKFQTLFIVMGVLSNLVGINMMLKIMQDNKIYINNCRVLKTILKLDMKKMLYATISLSIIILLIVLFITLR